MFYSQTNLKLKKIITSKMRVKVPSSCENLLSRKKKISSKEKYEKLHNESFFTGKLLY